MINKRMLMIIAGVLSLGLVITGLVLIAHGIRSVSEIPPVPPLMSNGHPGVGPDGHEAFAPNEQPRHFERELLHKLMPEERMRAIRHWRGLRPEQRRELFDELLQLEEGPRLERMRELIADIPLGPPPVLWPLLLIVIGSAGGAVVVFLHLLRREKPRRLDSCPHCGRPVESGWKFCPYCTKRLTDNKGTH